MIIAAPWEIYIYSTGCNTNYIISKYFLEKPKANTCNTILKIWGLDFHQYQFWVGAWGVAIFLLIEEGYVHLGRPKWTHNVTYLLSCWKLFDKYTSTKYKSTKCRNLLKNKWWQNNVKVTRIFFLLFISIYSFVWFPAMDMYLCFVRYCYVDNFIVLFIFGNCSVSNE